MRKKLSEHSSSDHEEKGLDLYYWSVHFYGGTLGRGYARYGIMDPRTSESLYLVVCLYSRRDARHKRMAFDEGGRI